MFFVFITPLLVEGGDTAKSEIFLIFLLFRSPLGRKTNPLVWISFLVASKALRCCQFLILTFAVQSFRYH